MTGNADDFEATASPLHPPDMGADCLSDEICIRLCHESFVESEIQPFMAHVATYTNCAERLQDYMQLLDEEISADEAALLAQLSSSTPQGLSTLARKMAAQPPGRRVPYFVVISHGRPPS